MSSAGKATAARAWARTSNNEPGTVSTLSSGTSARVPVEFGYDPKATWSMWLGISSLFIGGILTAVPAVILGHLSRGNIRKSDGRLRGKGRATAGLITGYFGIAVPVIILIFFFSFVMAFIGTQHASASDKTTGPAGNLHALNSALAAYKEKFHAYPPSLAALGPSGSNQSTADAANLVDFSLAVGLKDDYFFEYERTASGHNGENGYVVRASPFALHPKSGSKTLYSDQTGVIRETNQ